jgi:dUTPase
MLCSQNFLTLLKTHYITAELAGTSLREKFIKRHDSHTSFGGGDAVVPAIGTALVSTDLQVRLPDCCYGRNAPRSVLALQHHISVGAGEMDADYRGHLSVVLFKHSDRVFTFPRGN